MSEQMFEALMELIDAKLAVALARDRPEGAWMEQSRFSTIESDFISKFVTNTNPSLE